MKKNMKDKKITVGIADDHAILRQGLESLINQEQDIEVVGEASDGHETLELIEAKQPDILILDIAMPKLNGIEVSKRVRSKYPNIKIIILSMYDNQEYIFELFSCGVHSYLPKESVASDLISAIRAVYKGDFYLSPSISKQVISGFLQMGEGGKIEKSEAKQSLTNREREILQLIAEGYSSREIANLINTSIQTVNAHRNNLMKKLKIHRKSELIKYAIQHGIIQINTKLTYG